MSNYPRVNYEMTEEDLKEILEACRPVPCIAIGGVAPSSPQENANRAWGRLGKKMGFESDTVRPIEGKDQRFFSAVPSETESQRDGRLKMEEEKNRLAKIVRLEAEIKERQDALDKLRSEDISNDS